MKSYQKQNVSELNAEIEARGKFAAQIGLPEKLEALVKELPAEFLERFRREAKAFGFDGQSYIEGECEHLAHSVLHSFDFTRVQDFRAPCSSLPGNPGVIFRRNCLPEPFWRKEDRTPARDKESRLIREHNREHAKAA
jgi:hypothetical protein